MGELVFSTQKVFQGFTGIAERRHPEEMLPTGASSVDVLEQILQLRPEINNLSLVIYDRNLDRGEPLMNKRKNDTLWWVDSNKFSTDFISTAMVTLSELPNEWGVKRSWALAASSLVTSRDSWVKKHIPMVDFKCVPGKGTLANVINDIKAFSSYGGYLLQTQHGYHFYGLDLYGEEVWRVFLKGIREKSSLIDPTYIDFCLEEGISALSLGSSCSVEKLYKVVDIIRPG